MKIDHRKIVILITGRSTVIYVMVRVRRCVVGLVTKGGMIEERDWGTGWLDQRPCQKFSTLQVLLEEVFWSPQPSEFLTGQKNRIEILLIRTDRDIFDSATGKRGTYRDTINCAVPLCAPRPQLLCMCACSCTNTFQIDCKGRVGRLPIPRTYTPTPKI